MAAHAASILKSKVRLERDSAAEAELLTDLETGAAEEEAL